MADETSVDFQQTYQSLRAEELRLSDQRDALELELAEVVNRLEHVKGALRHLSPLAGETFCETNDFGENLSEFGITDAVRHVLQNGQLPEDGLTASDVIQKLKERGFVVSKYTNPMASVYKILSRLVDEKKDVERVGEKSPFKYRWIGEPGIPF